MKLLRATGEVVGATTAPQTVLSYLLGPSADEYLEVDASMIVRAHSTGAAELHIHWVDRLGVSRAATITLGAVGNTGIARYVRAKAGSSLTVTVTPSPVGPFGLTFDALGEVKRVK